MFSFLEGFEFGQRLFANDKWWIVVKCCRDSIYLVVDPYAVTPAPVLFVIQSEKNNRYQELLFRRF